MPWSPLSWIGELAGLGAASSFFSTLPKTAVPMASVTMATASWLRESSMYARTLTVYRKHEHTIRT